MDRVAYLLDSIYKGYPIDVRVLQINAPWANWMDGVRTRPFQIRTAMMQFGTDAMQF